MKELSIVLLVALASCTSLYRASYITTGSLTTAVELARQAYVEHENTCSCVTQTEHDKVMSYYVKYQTAAMAAESVLAGAQGATVPNNATITVAVNQTQSAAQDVVTLVESLMSASEAIDLKAKLPKEARLK